MGQWDDLRGRDDLETDRHGREKEREYRTNWSRCRGRTLGTFKARRRGSELILVEVPDTNTDSEFEIRIM